jgi:hypothetical protein
VTGPVHALLLAGGEAPYVDPWHPFAETSDRLGALAEALGWSVERADDVGARLAEGLDGVDVLLVNAPAPKFALHIGAVALLGLPRWNALTGARWIEGVTGHPPLGACVVHGHDDPRVPGDLELVDERYTDLALEGDRTVLASYEGDDGRTHPLVWAREVDGARVLVDTFGHDGRSFDSATHRELLERSLRWVAG